MTDEAQKRGDARAILARYGGRPNESIHPANAQGRVVIEGSAEPSPPPPDLKSRLVEQYRRERTDLGVLGRADAAVRGAANDLTFNYADKLEAATGALFGSGEGKTFSERYEYNKTAQEAINQVDSEIYGTEQKIGQAGAALVPAEKVLRFGKWGERILRRSGGKKKGKDCPTCSPKPVSLFDGAKVLSDVDFVLPGALPLELSRAYFSNLDFDGPLGRNRIGAFDEMLVQRPDGDLVYLMGSGLNAEFARPAPNPGAVSRNARHPQFTLSADRDEVLVVRHLGLFRLFRKYGDKVWLLEELRDASGARAEFARDGEGVLTRIDRSDGFSLVFENDGRGLRTAITLRAPTGETRLLIRFVYDERENMIEARNSYGPSYHYEYDEHGRFRAYEDGVKLRNEYIYDGAGRVAQVTTRDGRSDHTLAYGPGERETTLTYMAAGAATRYTFDDNGQTLTETDPLGAVRTVERDAFGKLLAEIDPEGHRTSYGYDAFGHPAFVIDPEGRRTSYQHDLDGRLERLTDGAGNSWEWGYDERGALAWARDPLGHRTDFVNDPAGLPAGIMRHDGLIEKREYDARNLLERVVDFRGAVTRFGRDAFGRVVARTDALGHVTRYAYDERPGADFWIATAVTRPDGVTTRRTEDRGRAETAMTDGEGRRTIYRQGPFGLLEEIEDSKGGRLRFAYDHEDRLIEVENQIGLRWTFERDAAGRVVRETDFSGLVAEYSYDAASRVIESRHPDGARLSYSYDRSGLLVRQEAWSPGAAEPEVTLFWHDPGGSTAGARNGAATVAFERDGLGRIVAETLNGRRVESAYDCCGNRTERRIGARLVESLYDPLGALSELRIGESAPLRFERDAAGRETRRRSVAGFSLEQAWDVVGQLRSQRVARLVSPAAPAPSGVARVYDWTGDFAPKAIRDSRWGETAYVEDDIGQVVEAGRGDGTSERFGYDAALNLDASGGEIGALRFWRTEQGGRVSEAFGPHGERISLSYDARHRVVERRVERDGFRPKVWRYGWDAEDRLVACETPSGERWAYAYDPFGRRVSKTRRLAPAERAWTAMRHPRLVLASAEEREAFAVAAVAPPPGADALDPAPPVVGTAYQWDGDVLAEEAPLRLDGSVDWDAATRWHYEPGSFVPLAREASDGALAYVVTDHLGTPRELFGEDGGLVWAMEHGLWGEPRRLWTLEAANDNARRAGGPEGGGRVFGALALKDEPEALAARKLCPIRFQGQWEDEETGLSYNRFRHYDALTGQYASPDPIGIGGGTRHFAYGARSPVTVVDPLGLAGQKTTATGGSGRSYISGTNPVEGYGHVPDSQIRAAGEQAGWKARSAGYLDRGKPGSFYCCHAEQKAYMEGEQDINVDKEMCSSCQDWFDKVTRSTGQPARVTDPTGVRRFPK